MFMAADGGPGPFVLGSEWIPVAELVCLVHATYLQVYSNLRHYERQ